MTDDLSKSKVLDVDSTVVGAVNELAALTAVKRPAVGEVSGHKAKRVREYDLLPEDEQGQLKWRGDPRDTYSDWTIDVVSEAEVPPDVHVQAHVHAEAQLALGSVAATPASKGVASTISPSPGQSQGQATSGTTGTIEIETHTQTFHVHRYFLGFGTRRSLFFTKLFQESSTRANKTRLELEPLAAKAFPAVLDFLYDPRSPLEIETETATALHHLGTRLEMTHLQIYAKEFLVADLSLQNLETYYQHAKQFNDAVVMQIIVQFIGTNIAEISASSNFVKHQTTADLWQAAFQHVIVSPTAFTTDLHLSKLVTEFVLANQPAVTDTIFKELTDEAKIRQVDPDVALQLVQLDDHFHPNYDATATGELSTLQDRCATALAEVWKELDSTTEQDLSSRSPLFLCRLLTKCLQEAKKELGRPRAAAGSVPVTSRSSRSRADRVDSGAKITPARRPARGTH
jgi:BTB/POZ domain